MHDQLAVAALSLGSGIVVASQEMPGLETILDRAGVAAIAVMVVWWMLGSFSKRLDKLTEAIEKLTNRVEKEQPSSI